MAAGAGRNADTTASQIPECILELISAGQARRYWRGFSGQPVKCRRNSRHGPIVNAVVPHGHEDAPNPGSKWLLPSTVSRQGSGGRGGRLPLSSRHHFSFPRAQALRTEFNHGNSCTIEISLSRRPIRVHSINDGFRRTF